MLPHLRDRPFTIKQHYNGPRSPFRWLKDKPADAPGWVPTTAQPAKSRGGALVHYVLVPDRRTLLWLVDYGCVDLHVWTSRIDRPDRPDVVLLDLDPGDVKMNGHGQQIVAPYSIRPVAAAAVAAPLAWDEVGDSLVPDDFTPEVVARRVEERGDLAGRLLEGGQSIAAFV